jgi:hypothetical protein
VSANVLNFAVTDSVVRFYVNHRVLLASGHELPLAVPDLAELLLPTSLKRPPRLGVGLGLKDSQKNAEPCELANILARIAHLSQWVYQVYRLPCPTRGVSRGVLECGAGAVAAGVRNTFAAAQAVRSRRGGSSSRMPEAQARWLIRVVLFSLSIISGGYNQSDHRGPCRASRLNTARGMPVTSRRLRNYNSGAFHFSAPDRGDRQVFGVPRRPPFMRALGVYPIRAKNEWRAK